MQDKKKILALAGSLRRESYNRALLVGAAAAAPEHVDVTVYDDLAAVPMFSEDLEAETDGGPGGVLRLREAVAAADGVIIATPEYNSSFPGVLKNALDWLSRSQPTNVLSGKPVAVTGATVGVWGTRLAQAALRQTLSASGALLGPQPQLYVAHAKGTFGTDGAVDDDATRERLGRFVETFAATLP